MTRHIFHEVIRSSIMLTGYQFESIRALHAGHVICEMLSTACASAAKYGKGCLWNKQ